MRRGRREKTSNIKYLVYLSGGIALIMLLTFAITFVVYNNKIKESNYSALTTEKIAELVPNDDVNLELEEASTDIGKSIEEAIESMEQDVKEVEEKEEETNQEVKDVVDEEVKEETKTTNVEPEVVKDPEFIMPVEGEIVRSFAKDSLIYSETLEEWIVHLGIDIKADRTTVVKAAEAGTITAIKNDPRYGLTVVIEHVNGYKTVYSNLLTTEFVEEGETVEKGQSIGTVGNSAAFEIVDEPHLHFEILKDEIQIDPNIYLN
ncbi:MAG: peptidoglycan DD-metalloendopeptidase family protein [Clostridia bacterium]|nr:peptidoglycan DD-metalloendopeptidase family protein [Clostridia bacterium]